MISIAAYLTLVTPQGPDASSIVADIDAYAQLAKSTWKVPGMAVAIIQGDKIIFEKCYGVRKYGGNDPITPQTSFQIGSISKSFTATALARMVDMGKLSLDERAEDLVPEFQMYDPYATRSMKLWDLMAQHSGTPSYAGDSYMYMNPTRDQVIHAIRYIKPTSTFREQFNYVNNLWLVAAKAGENRYGKSWETYLSDLVFKPLGLTRTSTGYNELYAAGDFAFPHATPTDPIEKADPETRGIYIIGPAGGVNSSIRDMSKYLMMHLHAGKADGKEFLKRQTANELHVPRTPILGDLLPSTTKLPVNTSYCQAFVSQNFSPSTLVWHNGGTGGARTIMGFIPDADMGIVVLTNLADTQVPEALMYRFYDAVFGKPKTDYIANYMKKPKPPTPARPATPVPARALSAYAGKFQHPIFGTLEFKVNGDSLTAKLPNQYSPFSFKLSAWDGDQFQWTTVGSVNVQTGFASFQFGLDGKVASVKLNGFADDLDSGVFTLVP